MVSRPAGRSRRVSTLALLAALAGALLVFAPPAAAAPSPAGCENRTNTTYQTLLECVTLEGVREHQAALQEIANANGGTRAAGTPGYDASVDYVVDTLEAAGWSVDLNFFDFTVVQPVEQLTPTVATHAAGGVTGSALGTVTNAVTPIDINLTAADGSPQVFQARTSLLPGSDSSPAGVIVLMHEVTREREMEQAKRDFITGEELGAFELAQLLDSAVELKSGRREGVGGGDLAGRSIALLFEKPSTRTRISFEVGVAELGATPLVLRGDEMQLSRGESAGDTGRVLSRFLDAIVIRSGSHEAVAELAAGAEIPVVNALTPLHHPCQALADLLTLRERRGDLHGLRLAYVGDGNNVARSLAIRLDGGRVELDGSDVSAAIRRPQVSESASRVSVHPHVREAMVALQRRMIATGSFVAEGRDIGTVVSPESPLKVFLTASPQERARRRAAQTGEEEAVVLAAQRERDERDECREHSALRAAPDAVEIDTTGMALEVVVERVVELAGERGLT